MKNSEPDVKEIATYESKPDKAKILAADKGITHIDAGKRVFFGAQYFDNLNETGVALFDSSLDWLKKKTLNSSVILQNDKIEINLLRASAKPCLFGECHRALAARRLRPRCFAQTRRCREPRAAAHCG